MTVDLYPARPPKPKEPQGTAARVVRILTHKLAEAVEFEATLAHATYVRTSGNKFLRRTHPHLMLRVEAMSPRPPSIHHNRTWSAYLVQRTGSKDHEG